MPRSVERPSPLWTIGIFQALTSGRAAVSRRRASTAAAARAGGVLVDVRMGVVADQHVGRAHHQRRQVGVQVQGRHQRRAGTDRRADRLQDSARHVGVVDRRLRPVQGEQHPVDGARAQRLHGHLDQLRQQPGGQRPARPGDRPAQADPLHRAPEDLRQLREPGQLAHVAVTLDDVGARDQSVVLEVGAVGEHGIEGIGLLADLPDCDAFHAGPERSGIGPECVSCCLAGGVDAAGGEKR